MASPSMRRRNGKFREVDGANSRTLATKLTTTTVKIYSKNDLVPVLVLQKQTSVVKDGSPWLKERPGTGKWTKASSVKVGSLSNRVREI
jgi:hypothetical protein